MEAMLVAPVLFAVLLGILEFGLIYRDALTTSSAVNDVARMGAVIGPRPVPFVTQDSDGDDVTVSTTADFAMMTALREGLSSIPVDSIERIVFFRGAPGGAGTALNQLPSSCRYGTGAGMPCNIYEPREAFEAAAAGDSEYFCGSGGVTCAWHPYTRKNGPRPSDVEYLGVYVRLERPYLTGLFGDVFTYESASVLRLEAGVFDED